ncbi:hypothetical protein GCM10027062_18430 [Nocardioides hungaricus]
MTEQQIKDGFDQLAGALAPPPDSVERVDRRVRVRRRRRRATMAGTVAVAVVAAAGTAAVLTSGDRDGGDLVATDPPSGPVSTLVLTRPDGSTYAFDEIQVSCDPPIVQGTGQPIESPTPGTIWASSPISFQGDRGDDDATLDKPFVMVQGRVAQLQGDRTFELPIDGPGDSDTYPLVLFVADTEGGSPGDLGNEAASSAGGSGTVRVLEASCDPVPVLRLEVDGTLASEEGKQPLDLTGELR